MIKWFSGCVISVLFLCSVVYSQPDNIEILWGSEQESSIKKTLNGFMGYDKKNIYIIKKEKKGTINFKYYIYSYGHDLIFNGSKEIELNIESKSRKIEFIVFYNSNIYLFSSTINKKEHKKTLFYQTINKSSMIPNEDITEIGDVTYKNILKGSFGFNISKRKTKFLVYYALVNNSRENEKFFFQTFDKDMNFINSKSLSIPFEKGLFTVMNYFVDDEGNVYLPGRLFEKINIKSPKDFFQNRNAGIVHGKFTYHILRCSKNSGEFDNYIISKQDRFLTDMQVCITDNGDIICAGFYSEQGNYSIKGSYYIVINPETGKIKNEKYQEFDINFINQYTSLFKSFINLKKNEKGKNVEMFNYKLDDIILRKDGGVFLIAEQYYVYTPSTASEEITSTTAFHYYYNDIIVVNIDPDGKDYYVKIPKKQHSVNDNGIYSSYTAAYINKNLYFVYNDNKKNIEVRKEENSQEEFKPSSFPDKPKQNVQMSSRNSIVTIASIDSFGNINREILFNTREVDTRIIPKFSYQINKSEMLLFGQKFNKHKFAKLTFK